MTINSKADLQNMYDLSSFEPEALLNPEKMLASLPGEHPRMAAGLAVGREASQTGHLDVDELSRIASELYTEGFPADTFGQSVYVNKQAEIPSTASLSDARGSSAQNSQSNIPSLSAYQTDLSSAGNARKPNDLSLAHLQYKPDFENQLELSHLPDGLGISQQSQLNALLADMASNPTANGRTKSLPSLNHSQLDHYFLREFSTASSNTSLAQSAHPAFDVNLVRKDFPILQKLINGRPLIWFDNAATTQKPQAVIDRISYFYQHENSNIHRAAHELAARATDAYEGARESVRRFINAPSVDNIVFVRGTTEAINLVAKTWGKKHLSAGDEIVISHLEHHANIVPWQQLCQETGAKLKVAPVDNSGQILLDEYQKLLTPKVKLVSFTLVSNALGTVTPASEMIQMAHRAGAKVLLDGAQSVSHMRTDIIELDPDFFVFSGHKVFGPTGIGVLYAKADVLDDMPAWQGGGNMIKDVTFDKTVYHDAPAKFEAGTGNIADAVGLGAALEYVERIGIENIARYEHELLVYATAALCKVPGLHLIGTAQNKASVLSFNLDGYKSEEVGDALNQEGIAVRSGHHCAQPILRRFGVETTVRPSLAFYNTYAEIDVLVSALLRLSSNKNL